MVVASRSGHGPFNPTEINPTCIPIQMAASLDNGNRLLGLSDRPQNNPLYILGRAVMDFANNKGIITSRFTERWVLEELDSTNIRVQKGERQVVYRGCIANELSFGIESVARVVGCPEDPASQCGGCYKKFIESLRADTDKYTPDNFEESRDYESALAELSETLDDPSESAKQERDRDVQRVKELLARVKEITTQLEVEATRFMSAVDSLREGGITEKITSEEDIKNISADMIRSLEDNSLYNQGLRNAMRTLHGAVSAVSKGTPRLSEEKVRNVKLAGYKLVSRLVTEKQIK